MSFHIQERIMFHVWEKAPDNRHHLLATCARRADAERVKAALEFFEDSRPEEPEEEPGWIREEGCAAHGNDPCDTCYSPA